MNIEKLSREVFRLNFRDKFSEDYVYFQIINYLAEYGKFTVSELDKRFLLKKEKYPKKTFHIERRKLKKILYGDDKNFHGLIPLNYVIEITPKRFRGGYQERNYCLTEKGIMASLGFSSYKKNINIKKFLNLYDLAFGKPFNKFAAEFMKLQIQIFLLYHYIQGITLTIKHDYQDDYDDFRKLIVNRFSIREPNSMLTKELSQLIQKLNVYRIIHSKFLKDNILLRLVWKEPYEDKIVNYGFEGWYRTSILTKHDVSPSNYTIIKRYDEPKPKREFVAFQNNSTKIPRSVISREMKQLGISNTSTTKFNSQILYSEKSNYEKKFQNTS